MIVLLKSTTTNNVLILSRFRLNFVDAIIVLLTFILFSCFFHLSFAMNTDFHFCILEVVTCKIQH